MSFYVYIYSRMRSEGVLLKFEEFPRIVLYKECVTKSLILYQDLTRMSLHLTRAWYQRCSNYQEGHTKSVLPELLRRGSPQVCRLQASYKSVMRRVSYHTKTVLRESVIPTLSYLSLTPRILAWGPAIQVRVPHVFFPHLPRDSSSSATSSKLQIALQRPCSRLQVEWFLLECWLYVFVRLITSTVLLADHASWANKFSFVHSSVLCVCFILSLKTATYSWFYNFTSTYSSISILINHVSNRFTAWLRLYSTSGFLAAKLHRHGSWPGHTLLRICGTTSSSLSANSCDMGWTAGDKKPVMVTRFCARSPYHEDHTQGVDTSDRLKIHKDQEQAANKFFHRVFAAPMS